MRKFPAPDLPGHLGYISDVGNRFEVLTTSSFWTGIGSVATSLTVIRALWDFRRSRRRAEMNRREQVFALLDDGWREWLGLVLDHPELDLGDMPLDPPPLLNPIQKVQREALLHMLVSLLEKAYLLYQSDEFSDLDADVRRRTNKEGWETYIDFWRDSERLKDVDWNRFLANYSPAFRKRMTRVG